MTAPGFLDRVKHNALLLKQRLAELKDRHGSVIAEVRGEGLLIGLDLSTEASADVLLAARRAGFIINNATPRRIRLAPPLILTEDDANAFLAAWPAILDEAIG
jgi:acetylornithine/succinyldiaminopimelate/putrescine aminotransferase